MTGSPRLSSLNPLTQTVSSMVSHEGVVMGCFPCNSLASWARDLPAKRLMDCCVRMPAPLVAVSSAFISPDDSRMRESWMESDREGQVKDMPLNCRTMAGSVILHLYGLERLRHGAMSRTQRLVLSPQLHNGPI